MFRRPGESQLGALMRNSRETAQARRQRDMAGQYWLDQQKQQYKPDLKDLTRLQGQQLKPSATIQEVRPEFDIEHQGEKGMGINLAFSVLNPGGRTVIAAAYFYFANGVPLRDTNGEYCTSDGNVCAWSTFEPGYFNTRYRGIALFIPYYELHMRRGNHSLRVVASIWDDQSRELARSDWYPFTLQVG